MSTTITPRQRVETALAGEKVDKVPFTMYERKIPQCAAEREMRWYSDSSEAPPEKSKTDAGEAA